MQGQFLGYYKDLKYSSCNKCPLEFIDSLWILYWGNPSNLLYKPVGKTSFYQKRSEPSTG